MCILKYENPKNPENQKYPNHTFHDVCNTSISSLDEIQVV